MINFHGPYSIRKLRWKVKTGPTGLGSYNSMKSNETPFGTYRIYVSFMDQDCKVVEGYFVQLNGSNLSGVLKTLSEVRKFANEDYGRKVSQCLTTYL